MSAHITDETSHRPRTSRVVLLTAWVVVTAVGAVLWRSAPSATDRVATVAVVLALTVGLLGQLDAPRGTSRLPVAAQGVVVGALCGVLVGTAVTAGLSVWGLLWALASVPGLFPAVVPSRWHWLVEDAWWDRDSGGSPGDRGV